MDIRELRYIAEIGKTGHIIGAAKNLYISQPALHKTLRKVEAELGEPLFYHEGNQLVPTEIGKIVLEAADKVEKDMNVMNDSISATKNIQRGRVILGFPSIVGLLFLPELLIRFQRQYPEIYLQTVEAGGGSLSDMVESGALDMAIVMRPILSDALNEIPLVMDEVKVGVSPSHPLAQRRFLTMQDLKDLPFITFDNTFQMRAQLTQRLEQEKIEPQILFSGASCEFLYELARLSDTPLILPGPIIDYYAKGNMTLIPFHPSFPWELCLIFRKNAYMSIAGKALIGHIQKSMMP